MSTHTRWENVATRSDGSTNEEALNYVRGYILAIDDAIHDLEKTRAEAERTLALLQAKVAK